MKNGLVAVLSVVVFCGLVAVVDIICVKYEIPRFTMFSFIVIGIVVMIFALGSQKQAAANDTVICEDDDDFGDEQDLIDGEAEDDLDDEEDFDHDYDDDEEEAKK